MGIRGAFLVGAVLALALVPAAQAGRSVAVGYRTVGALAGAHVLRIVPQLRVAEVAARDAATLRGRPGIRFVGRLAERASADDPALLPWTGAAGVPEWQFAATRADLVPTWVQRAAADVTIAVVDTGADVTAPDIAAKEPVTYNVVTGGPDVRDTIGHGTFVASLAAGAVTNGDGIAGFGGDAKLMIVAASRNSNTFTDVDEAAAITYAVDHGARIVNLSLGGPQTSRTERDAIQYALDRGVLVVAAAGNDGARGNPAEYPAALLDGHGLAVAASTAAGKRASFSTAGPYVSIAAPGVNVIGAVASTSAPSSYARTTLPGASAGLYGFGSGTSYAAPEVAGAAALVWAANPTLTADQVASTLEQTASGGGAWTPGLGYGVLDVARAVASATGAPMPPLAPKTVAMPMPKQKAKAKPLRTKRR